MNEKQQKHRNRQKNKSKKFSIPNPHVAEADVRITKIRHRIKAALGILFKGTIRIQAFTERNPGMAVLAHPRNARKPIHDTTKTGTSNRTDDYIKEG